ncbi:MAG: N-acetylglucosamine kinase [Gammaproteobacteria bacterium]|nr:N-acetylglucosamine kinase [Gammaproteobacteria bacterium]
MKCFLGIDGGGSKTAFVLLDEDGKVRARHREGAATYLELGLTGLQELLARGTHALLRQAHTGVEEVTYAFLGIPCYGEDSTLVPSLDRLPGAFLPPGRWTCGNDVVCGWAGALGGAEGINVVAGTGSIAYGELGGRCARAGGWGERFSDEGSAWWIACEGLAAFARMSDGRLPRTQLYDCVRRHFGLESDLDLCAALNAPEHTARGGFARLAPLVTAADAAGDPAAAAIIRAAARELAGLVRAVRPRLATPRATAIPVSWSGSLFGVPRLLQAFRAEFAQEPGFALRPPRLPPDVGAALQAARLHGTALTDAALASLEASAA